VAMARPIPAQSAGVVATASATICSPDVS
jgi:hypothetical protein